MTYRARCEGRKGKRGRRWLNLAKWAGHGRSRPFWCRVLGDYKLSDIQTNLDGETIRKLAEAEDRMPQAESGGGKDG